MSIKKELLSQLTETQLRDLAENKGLNFNINTTRKKYYEGWSEKEKLVDMMTDHKSISVAEIEQYILEKKPE